MELDRRSLLGMSLGLAGAVTMAPLAMPTAARAATTAGTPDPVTLQRKLKFRTDDGLIFWWLQGPKIGVVDTTLTPLYTNSVGTIQRIRQLEDGGLEMTMLEMVLLFDVETGEPLETWRNPYTGEELPVRFRPAGPLKVQYRPDNSRILPTDIGGTPLEASAKSHPPLIVNDDVFVQDESVARVFTPGRERPFQVNDIAVYHGSLRNLADPAVTMGEATVFFGEITDWQRWMNMGERPGTLTSRSVGRKCSRWEDLPEGWRQRLAEVAPDIADDPIGALDEPAPQFER